MRKILLTLWAICLLPSVSVAMDAVALLQQADKGRSPYIQSLLEINISSYDNNMVKDSTDFLVYSNNGDSLIYIQSGKSKGQRVLLIDKGMYIATKRASRPVRITPLQRLMGQASYGDLASLQLAKDYIPKLLDETDTEYTLELHAKTKKATYRKLHLWISKQTKRFLRSDAYLASGRLNKRIVYTYNADGLVSEMRYSDPKIPNKHTVMTIKSVQPKKIANRYFRPDGMREKIR